MEDLKLLLHNKDQFFDPNDGMVFGSESEKLSTRQCNKEIGCHQNFWLSRIYWDAMDYKEQPCDETGTSINTRQCISNFIREKVGCYIPMQNMEQAGKPKCHTSKQFDEILNLTALLTKTDSDAEIYKLTGCLSSCKKVFVT